ncbi:MAG TPA: hypothetical protein VM677_09300 [Actinokineospora sp.]|nr:hypothetical protein [Actinokineospora sp.]
MSMTSGQEPPTANTPVEAARLLAILAQEFGRRLIGQGSPLWAEYPDAFLRTVAQGALNATLGLTMSAGTCMRCGLDIVVTPNGWCCIGDHCLPRGL